MKSENLYPKDVFGSFSIRDRIIAEFAIKANFINVSDGIKDISNVLSKHKLDILDLILTSMGSSQFFIAIVDCSRIEGELEKAIKDIENINGVNEVKYATKKLKEKLVDRFTIPTFGGGRFEALILGKDEFSQVLTEIKKSYGSGGEAFLYMIGFKLGSVCGEKYKPEMLTAEFIREDVLIFQAFGWGIPEIRYLDIKKPKIVIRFHKLFESAFVSERKTEPYCYFFKGFITGLFSKFFKKDLSVVEVKCIAKGDPYCEFIIEAK